MLAQRAAVDDLHDDVGDVDGHLSGGVEALVLS
jgi:hypothetical protein